MPTFDTPDPIDLDVTTGMGRIEIVATDRADTVAEVLPSNPRRHGDVTLARDATVEFTAGRLRVLVPKRLNLFGPGDSVDVRVQLPTGSRVTVESAYGSVVLRGTFGVSAVRASYGAVTIGRTADLVLKVPYGELEVQEVVGDLTLTAGHGRHRVAKVTGDVRITGSHGAIDLGDIGGDVEARASGPFTIDRAGGNVTVQTAYGAVRVREVTGGTVRLENGYAEIEVGVPAGVAAWVDAASQHGVVRNELTPEGGPGESDRTVELRLRANYGDVIVARSNQKGLS